MLLEEINKKNTIEESFIHFIDYYKKISQKSGYEFFESDNRFYVKTDIDDLNTNFVVENIITTESIIFYDKFFSGLKYSFLVQNNNEANISQLNAEGFNICNRMSFMKFIGGQYNLSYIGYKNLDKIVVVNDYYSQSYIDYVNIGMNSFNISYDFLHNVTPLLKNNNTEIFVGYYNNIAVSSCITIQNNGTTSIFAVNTDKNFRNQGFATDLIKRVVMLYNHDEIVLYSWPDTINLYSKLGFISVEEILYLSRGC